VRDVFLNKYDEYGCRRAFGAQKSMTEEVAFSIASAEFGLLPVEMEKFPILNYNPRPGQSYKQFTYPFPSANKDTLFHLRPPFVHLWDKFYGLNYQRVFCEVITKLIDQDICIPIPILPPAEEQKSV
jgi:hypothetical protein